MLEEKKEYLNKYMAQGGKIKRLQELALKNTNKVAEYQVKIAKAIQLRNEIEEKIERLNNPILSEILFQKYVFGKTLEEISVIINYSKRQTERLHIKALEKFSI